MRSLTVALLCLTLLAAALSGCAPKVNLFGSQATDPLREYVLSGDGEGKVLQIHLRGMISDESRNSMFRTQGNVIQEMVSQLDLAALDDDIKAVVITINSPGGTVTASDILYNELTRFRETTGKKVVVVMLDVAASGGYYASLAADWIVAHPTTVTGSVGVIFMRPKLDGLMDKIGVGVEISKSGVDKDMGSPFRPTTEEETALFQAMIDDMAARFHSLVRTRREISDADMETVKTARVFTATQALKLGLVDEVGYMDAAFAKARELGGLDDNAQLVVYRRADYPDDNPYNTLSSAEPVRGGLLGVDMQEILPLTTGFYYLWTPGAR